MQKKKNDKKGKHMESQFAIIIKVYFTSTDK